MSHNFTNDFQPHSNSPLQCSDSASGRDTLTVVSFSYALFVVPLSIFILYLGFQQWRKLCSTSPEAIVTHSDFFTYNMTVVELLGIFGYTFSHCSSYTNLPVMLKVGSLSQTFTWPGLTLFPIFICVERYVAVVHPITYRALRQTRGVRIRNISTGCIWLSCFVWLGFSVLLNIKEYYRHVPAGFILTLSLIIMVYCSLSVVHALIRPQPGKVSRDRFQVDHLKQRAIRTTLIVMLVLWLKFCGNALVIVSRFSELMSLKCIGEAFAFMFFLPCSLALPLLFLERERKLPNCKHSTGSG